MGTSEDSHRRYENLDHALEQWNIPLENRPLIRAYAQALGFTHYEDRAGYLKAVRPDGPPLQIRYGYSTGFVSEEEARTFSGPEQDVWPATRKNLWGFTHPMNRTHERSAAARAAERDHGVCTSCFTQRSASGACHCD